TAARAGATYVSPFIGRLDDIGLEGLYLIEDVHYIFTVHEIDTEIISASNRDEWHVHVAAQSDADIANMTYEVLKTMKRNPLTDKGIDQFLNDWNSIKDQ